MTNRQEDYNPLRRTGDEEAADQETAFDTERTTLDATTAQEGDAPEHDNRASEEHSTNWETKREPEDLMASYHEKLRESHPTLASELLAASEGKTTIHNTSWLQGQNGTEPQDNADATFFKANREALRYDTNGDREQAAVILSYSITKPVEDAIAGVQSTPKRERLDHQLQYAQDTFVASLTDNNEQQYQDTMDYLKTISNEIRAIQYEQSAPGEHEEAQQAFITQDQIAATGNHQDQTASQADYDHDDYNVTQPLQDQAEHNQEQALSEYPADYGDQQADDPQGPAR